jgi:hypothetical protein
MSRVLLPGGRLILSTPLNFVTTVEWETVLDAWGMIALIERHDISVDLKFDGLVCREVNDARNNAKDWQVLVIAGTKMA